VAARGEGIVSGDAEPDLGHRVQVVSAVKRYGLTTALGGVDFDVAAGEFLVLLGPSGSGKSTLIRSLAGIERLDSGEVRLSGQLVSAGKANVPPEKRDLAMVFQDYALWPHLTAGGNVGYALRRRRLDTATAGERVTAALRRVGLADHALRYPHELSGGEQQRVALARALVARPRLLLFDEPLSNLDADLRERLRVEIGTLTRESGSTAIYITHDQSEAFALADKVGVLDRGTIVQFGRPEEIYRRPATPFVARFTGVAGELTGRVAHVRSGLAAVQVEGSVIDARTIGTMTSGENARVLVRPAAARLSGRAAGAEAMGANTIHGTVIDVAYRGRGYDHVVAIGPHVISAVHASRAHGRGDHVAVAFDTDHVLAYAG
jgi:ABC-type Fe3+/spermidine/putrescine transport system ATPase subunit